jgi:protein-disulfide isomerase
MPSGKRARQQRQATKTAAPPPVRSKGAGGARARQASPRALAIGGGVVLVIVIAIVLGFVLASGGGSNGGGSQVVSTSDMQELPATGSATWAGALAGAPAANNLFKGIPQHGLTLGDPKAPVTMEMFIDVQCPVCQDYEVNHLSSVVQKYIRTGKVQLHLKPWQFLGPQSITGRRGVFAAADQNKGYEYAKVLYDNQGEERTGWLTGREMASIAASVNGLDLARWRADVNNSASASAGDAVDALATQKKVQGTPTIFVGCTDGQLKVVMPPGSYAPQDVQPALDAAVAACHK